MINFNCRIGSRILRGMVKETSHAQKVYKEAISRSETTGLLTQLPEASDVKVQRIAPQLCLTPQPHCSNSTSKNLTGISF